MRGLNLQSKTDLGLTLPGGKTGVLLLHDVGGSAAELRGLAQSLSRCGFTVHCPQLIALGAQSQPGHGSAGMLVSEAEAALSKLKAKCEAVVVMGVELGAMLALELARHNAGTVQAAVAIAPRAWLPGLPIAPSALSGRIKQSWIAGGLAAVRGVRLGQAAQGLSARDGRSAIGLPELARLLDSVHAGLPSIRQPVLLVRRQTPAAPKNDAAFLLQRRLGGRVETIVVEESPEAGSDRSVHVLADRTARFIAGLVEELKVKRENEARRQRVAGGKTDAA